MFLKRPLNQAVLAWFFPIKAFAGTAWPLNNVVTHGREAFKVASLIGLSW